MGRQLTKEHWYLITNQLKPHTPHLLEFQTYTEALSYPNRPIKGILKITFIFYFRLFFIWTFHMFQGNWDFIEHFFVKKFKTSCDFDISLQKTSHQHEQITVMKAFIWKLKGALQIYHNKLRALLFNPLLFPDYWMQLKSQVVQKTVYKQ